MRIPERVPEHDLVVNTRGDQEIRVAPAEIHHVTFVSMEHFCRGRFEHLTDCTQFRKISSTRNDLLNPPTIVEMTQENRLA